MQSYMVVKGDTMWMIAKRFGVSLESLIKANPQVKDPNKIRPGDVLCIPSDQDGGCFVYLAKSGDTMWAVAEKFGVSLDDLLGANPGIENADDITVGQKICIPHGIAAPCGKGKCVNNGALYTLRAGEGLFEIAQRYAMNPEVLKAANPQIGNGEEMRADMQIYLPGFHYVKNGETFRSIAGCYGVRTEDLIRMNPLVGDEGCLVAGEKIAIPRRADGDIALYVIRPGDTLSKIARKYGVSSESLLLANDVNDDGERLCPGEEWRIPGPHLVKKGQTIYGIADLYGISVVGLEEANPDAEAENLRVGQMLRIPAEEKECRRKKDEESGVDYIVQSGDTLSGIAAMYQMGVKDLLCANPRIKDADEIFPGMVVRVPTGYVRRVGYVVKRGDSLWRIAAKFGITAAEILNSNPQLEEEDRLLPDQVLLIPIRGELREDNFRGSIEYPVIYEAREGDSLASVAERFGVSVEGLRYANIAMMDGDDLVKGQNLIVIPENYGDRLI